ncbi:hypothetical protein D3C76_1222710 [compost metagenome]
MRYLHERLPDQEDREHADTVGYNQAGVGIQQVKFAKYQVTRQIHGRTRYHIAHQNQGCQHTFETEFHMCQGVRHHTGVDDLK